MKAFLHDMSDDLLVKYLVGEANAEEIRFVDEWLQNDEENQKYYAGFILIWEQSLQLAPSAGIDEEASWARMQQRLKQIENQPVLTKILRIKNLSWHRVAALFLLFIGLAWVTYFVADNRGDEIAMVNVQSAEKVLTDTLSDGSVVTINRNSKLSYHSKFKGNTREVTMEGEAFFKVTPDKKRPFIIHVNDVTVKVVGTTFNIRSVNGKTEVIVETGTVQVTKQNNTVELTAGEKVVTQLNDASIVKGPVTDHLYNYYRSKEFICDNTPLIRLVEILNEAYNSSIVIENKSIEFLPITTIFKDEPLENILTVISATLGITIEKNEGEIILK